MKKTLQLLLALVFTTMFTINGLACDPPSNLRSVVEENVPGYGYKFKVTMSWDAVEGAELYSVYFHNDVYPSMWLGDTDGLYYIAGTNTEATFEFSVVAHCTDGTMSENSKPHTVVVQEGLVPCMTPTNLQAVVEEDVPGFDHKYKVTLTWDAVESAVEYELYQDGDMIATSAETTYVIGFDASQTVYFAVAAVCGEDNVSPISPTVMVPIDPCLAPTNLHAEVEENVPGFGYKYKVTLTWNAVEEALAYSVYENSIYVTETTTTSVEIGYDFPATLSYNVVTICENGESELSAPVSLTIGVDGPCPVPTNLGATIETNVPGYQFKYKVTMTWDEVIGAEGYKVYINNQLFGASSTNFYIAGSDVEGSFDFTVVSLCADGESEQSESYTVYVQEVSLEEYANKFEVYPNPAENNISINTNETINEINIYNIVGVCVYNENNFSGNGIDISNFNNGVYFIKINTEKGDVVKRFIKQ